MSMPTNGKEHNFVTIIFSWKSVFKNGTYIHPSERLGVIVRDPVYELTVSQFLSIQNQA